MSRICGLGPFGRIGNGMSLPGWRSILGRCSFQNCISASRYCIPVLGGIAVFIYHSYISLISGRRSRQDNLENLLRLRYLWFWGSYSGQSMSYWLNSFSPFLMYGYRFEIAFTFGFLVIESQKLWRRRRRREGGRGKRNIFDRFPLISTKRLNSIEARSILVKSRHRDFHRIYSVLEWRIVRIKYLWPAIVEYFCRGGLQARGSFSVSNRNRIPEWKPKLRFRDVFNKVPGKDRSKRHSQLLELQRSQNDIVYPRSDIGKPVQYRNFDTR